MFGNVTNRSYRDLPVRYADFSPLHRDEASGALTGLTRLRSFHQDDAHVYCASDQVRAEIGTFLSTVDHVYTTLGFHDYELALSTRPKTGSIGADDTWAHAEDALRASLAERHDNFSVNEGDGAFYGPKIDCSVKDAQGRSWQCGTIQLDLQLPKRFDLGFTDDAGHRRVPILLHRAVLGSFERMMAILVEHYQGRWPLWLSPRQVLIISVTNHHAKFAVDLEAKFRRAGIFADADVNDETVNKRIRKAVVLQYNYIVVVGDYEMQSGQINVRDGRDSRAVSDPVMVDTFIEELQGMINAKA